MSYISKYTNSNGVRLMSSLFVETSQVAGAKPVYTLYDYDKDGYPSLYLRYIAEEDPTEYLFAKKNLHDWKHWQSLVATEWFRPYIERWRQELELLIKAKTLRRMIRDSLEDGRDGQAAAKFVLEKGWGEKHSKGRPTKDQVREAADKLASDSSQLDNDMERLGLINVRSS